VSAAQLVRRWLRCGATALVVAGVALGAIGVAWAAHGDAATSPVDAALAAARPAIKPFRRLTATRIVVGRQTLRVVIADSDTERTQGLRRRHTIGRYDGMLFVYPSATTATFTMSTVPVALDIAFYASDGRVVRRLAMAPCAGTDSTCPGYPSGGAFRYALETLAGDLPRGRLRSPG